MASDTIYINPGRSTSKTLSTLALDLVRSRYDDELSFDDAVRNLADYYRKCGDDALANYALAQIPGNPNVFTTMDVDPLPNIARDLYASVERICGPDSEKAKEFRCRLSVYLDDFYIRCKEEQSIKPIAPQKPEC